MIRRWIGWIIWLQLAACLYFFENNTGTRAILVCSMLIPLIRPLREFVFFLKKEKSIPAGRPLRVSSFAVRETDEPGDLRPYVPGDPVRRIHWKLSVKKDELLIREAENQGIETEEERTVYSLTPLREKTVRIQMAWAAAAGALLCLILLMLIPQARLGLYVLCNRLFSASEAVNAYVYFRFPVSDSQNIGTSAFTSSRMCR